MIKNNNQNMPFYIFSGDKNNHIDIDLKTLNYDNVMANVTTDSEVKSLLMQFEKGYPSFSGFLTLIQKNYDTLEFRRFLESQLRETRAKKAVNLRKQYDPEILQKRIDLDEISLRHFNSVDTDALDLIRGKTGIYLFINKINKKKYIGKAKNLQDRLRDYTNKNSLAKATSSSMFVRALLKFGPDNFSFSIIEHCSAEMLNKREQFYIKLLKPQYNIRKPSCEDIKYPS
jgi:hypothetical protein